MTVISRVITYAKAALTAAARAAGANQVVGYNTETDQLVLPAGTTSSLTSPTLTNPSLGVATATSIALTAVGAAPLVGMYQQSAGKLALTNGSGVAELAIESTNVLIPTNHLVLAKTSGVGIKVDAAGTPTFGWRDIIGQVVARGSPAVDPAFNIFRTPIRAYQFTVNDEVYIAYHLPHDYVPGTDLHLHAHWAHASATVTSGSVTWTFESTYAKGHNQAAFIAPLTTTAVQTASTTQYQHMVAETAISSTGGSATLIDNALFEPDGIIMVRVRLTANTMNGTPEPFMFTCDLHYQSTNIGTKQKAPVFYT
jgi:hypothetical protein